MDSAEVVCQSVCKCTVEIYNTDYFLADRKMSILAEIRVYLLDLFDYIW